MSIRLQSVFIATILLYARIADQSYSAHGYGCKRMQYNSAYASFRVELRLFVLLVSAASHFRNDAIGSSCSDCIGIVSLECRSAYPVLEILQAR